MSDYNALVAFMNAERSTAILKYPSGRFGVVGSVPVELTKEVRSGYQNIRDSLVWEGNDFCDRHFHIGRNFIELWLWHMASGISCAAAVVVVHNHPSGSLEPSSQDLTITRKIVQAGEILGIRILDHIIIGKTGGYYSFRTAGMI
jgi:hypothetical protein